MFKMRCVFVSIILASCVGYSLQVCGGEEYGEDVQVCTAPDGHEIQPNENYESYETCWKCDCLGLPPMIPLRMDCCGIGINGGNFEDAPEGCKYIQGEQCEPTLVKESDESMPCN